MPQMSPMYWTMILMTMTMMIIQMSSMNYFESMNTKINLKKKKEKKIDWKW